MVEFAFILPAVLLILFGIITFGLLLNVDQDVTRAAAEGARAGAVAIPPIATPPTETSDLRYQAAMTATEEAVASFRDGGCGAGGTTCAVDIHNCSEAPALFSMDVGAYYDDGIQDCVSVRVVHDNVNHPIGPPIPFANDVLPDRLISTSVARLNEAN